MKILSFAEAEVPPGLRAQVLVLQDQAWPPELTAPTDGSTAGVDDPSTPSPTPQDAPLPLTHDPTLQPVSMLLVDEDSTVVAALDILRKDLHHAGQTYAAAGLSTVVTHPAHRGEGHGHRLVSAARAAMAADDVDLGIFTCDPELQHFYETCGWRVLAGVVIVGGTPDSPLRSDTLGKVTMAACFSSTARRHEGEFVDCDIALYPGNIDRLW